MDGLQIISLIVATVFLIPSVILLQQFRYTKIREYLVFSSFFIINFIFSIIVALSGVNFELSFDGNVSEKVFLISIQMQIILNLFAWFAFFYLGYRITWPNGNKLVLNGFLVFGLFQMALVALMKVDDIPSESKLGFITLKSRLTDTGAIVELFSDFYFGQGHGTIIILWNIGCVSMFTYSYFRMKNPFNYLHFSKIRKLWLLFSLSYLVSQIFVLISFIGNDTFLSFGTLFQLIGIIGILYVAIFTPEGLLLNHVQILKAVNLLDDLERNDKTMKFPLAKVFDYIEYMSQHVKSSINEDSK